MRLPADTQTSCSTHHTKGRSPEWALVCFHTLLWLGKCFPHNSHLYLLSVKCFAWWATISSLLSKRCQFGMERKIHEIHAGGGLSVVFFILRSFHFIVWGWRLQDGVKKKHFSTCTMLTEWRRRKKVWAKLEQKNGKKKKEQQQPQIFIETKNKYAFDVNNNTSSSIGISLSGSSSSKRAKRKRNEKAGWTGVRWHLMLAG